jgi:hypothetical protein
MLFFIFFRRFCVFDYFYALFSRPACYAADTVLLHWIPISWYIYIQVMILNHEVFALNRSIIPPRPYPSISTHQEDTQVLPIRRL